MEQLQLSYTVDGRVKFVKTTIKNCLTIPSKSYRNSTFTYIPQRNECLPKYMYTNVYNSNIHNSYQLEDIKCPPLTE